MLAPMLVRGIVPAQSVDDWYNSDTAKYRTPPTESGQPFAHGEWTNGSQCCEAGAGAGGTEAGRRANWGFLRNQGGLAVLDFPIVCGLGTQSHQVRAGEVVLEEGCPERHYPSPPPPVRPAALSTPRRMASVHTCLVAPGLQGLHSMSAPVAAPSPCPAPASVLGTSCF